MGSSSQVAPFAGNPIWSSVSVQTTGPDGKPTTQTIPFLSQTQFDAYMQRITTQLAKVSGFQGQQANITGPLDLNSNKLTGITNSSPPAADEALSYQTAQAMYQTWRQAGTTESTSYKATSSDGTILANAAQGAMTVTLPAPDSVAWYVFVVMKIDSSGNAVTVASANTTKGQAAKINGGSTATLAAQYNKGVYQSTGAGYIIIG